LEGNNDDTSTNRITVTANVPKVPLPDPAKLTGYLQKEGRNYKSWKRRFFVLELGNISYFEKEAFKDPNIGTHSLIPNLSSYRL
jgi:hypothetical protein